MTITKLWASGDREFKVGERLSEGETVLSIQAPTYALPTAPSLDHFRVRYSNNTTYWLPEDDAEGFLTDDRRETPT